MRIGQKMDQAIAQAITQLEAHGEHLAAQALREAEAELLAELAAIRFQSESNTKAMIEIAEDLGLRIPERLKQ